jgi:hypothetical protein
MGSDTYDTQKYTASMFAIRKAMILLREHFTNVEIVCTYIDNSNVEISCEQTWSEDTDDDDDDDDDDDKKVGT